MDKMPLISSDRELSSQIKRILWPGDTWQEKLTLLPDLHSAVEFLNAEMPDLICINFSDKKIDSFAILDAIMRDPWLLHGGIIALCETYKEVKLIEGMQKANIIVVLTFNELDSHLSKIADIIDRNQSILFQKEIGSDLVANISGAYKLENDPLEVRCYTNLICNFLYNSNKMDSERKRKLQLALTEMLLNAIEHGNCGISYDEKSQWLENGGTIDELIAQKIRDPEIKNKRVTFEYAIDSKCASFLIADEGIGFDWQNIKDTRKEENSLELHGRGILMTQSVVKGFRYNESGNAVKFEIDHQTDIEKETPETFHHLGTRVLNPGDIVFLQGEPGTFLYYIVKGEYDIFFNEKRVSTMTVDDIFMGEMSFLLNNRRSATVKARCEGKLIEISKNDFVEVVKRKPHYALFISRLLAKRIERLNRLSTKMV